ncbi:MAG: hypothetical protein ACRDHL_15645 [Candidatus Promineifilaceae bacterium]
MGEVVLKPSRRGRKPLVALGALWIVLGMLLIGQLSLAEPKIVISWETETEVETAGFNVYRSDSPAGSYTRLNEQLIPAQADSAAGASYRFKDTAVTSGVNFYYRLEDVALDNTTILHDPMSAQAARPPAWAWLLAGLALALGALLLHRAGRSAYG